MHAMISWSEHVPSSSCQTYPLISLSSPSHSLLSLSLSSLHSDSLVTILMLQPVSACSEQLRITRQFTVNRYVEDKNSIYMLCQLTNQKPLYEKYPLISLSIFSLLSLLLLLLDMNC